jgi:beta-lactamase class A
VLSVYLYNLDTGDELSLTLSNGEPITGPVAFSGMSTIKIPIMASFFTRNTGELDEGETLLLQRSIEESGNTATDLLLKTIGRGDGLDGTLRATDDMRRLGLTNTYISGLLDVQGRVLTPFATQANTRTDVTLQPDPYNQTTAEDMGVLLVMMYQCSQGGGALLAAFPGQVTAEECQKMLQFLTQNQVGPIFITGGSPGGVVAHKHGWDTVPLTNVGDAALVFTPGGDYVLTIYVHRRDTIGFEDANRLVISLARAVYNFFNGGPE